VAHSRQLILAAFLFNDGLTAVTRCFFIFTNSPFQALSLIYFKYVEALQRGPGKHAGLFPNRQPRTCSFYMLAFNPVNLKIGLIMPDYGLLQTLNRIYYHALPILPALPGIGFWFFAIFINCPA